MNKILIYLTLAMLLIFNGVLLYKMQAPKKLAESNSADETFLKLSKYYYNSMVINAQLNNNIKLDGSLSLTDLTNKKITINALVTNGMKMVVRSTEDGCGLCIENELSIIKKYAKLIGPENIVVITTHNNVRKLEVFKEANDIPFKMYICSDLGMPFERVTEKPFLFTLDPNLLTGNFFIPEVTLGEASDGYYSALYKRYFKTGPSVAVLTKF